MYTYVYVYIYTAGELEFPTTVNRERKKERKSYRGNEGYRACSWCCNTHFLSRIESILLVVTVAELLPPRAKD